MNQECNASKKVHLRQCHCFNLRQVTLAVTALYDKYLQEAGITAQQYSILWHSKELGPLSITELASAMNWTGRLFPGILRCLRNEDCWKRFLLQGGEDSFN